MKRFAIVALAFAAALTSAPPAMAFPMISAPRVGTPQTQLVEYRRYGGGYYHGHHHGGGDDWAWALGGLAAGAIIGGLMAQPRYYGPSYYEPDYYGRTYYRPRYYAPRYARDVYYGGDAHTRWCYARYRSYGPTTTRFSLTTGHGRRAPRPTIEKTGEIKAGERSGECVEVERSTCIWMQCPITLP